MGKIKIILAKSILLLKSEAKFARLRQKPSIFENRSAAYLGVCEQRITENRGFLPSIVEFSLRLLIYFYRFFISPFLGNHCRFYPSCSEYAVTAIHRFGVTHGVFLSIKRLLRCHPWHEGGIDPVPNQKPEVRGQKTEDRKTYEKSSA
jgi:putative membrane protein insertion efficiency factor